MKAATCRSCGASITWAVTVDGKRMPVDAEPAADGTLEFTGSLDDGTPLVEVTGTGDGARYRSHFATCPQAGRWRRG